MEKFTDTITITIEGGHGGAGAVSFHREKFITHGGPDGGDGGVGGSVYFEADRRYYNLSHFFKNRLYQAGNGKPGSAGNCHGGNGANLVIKVPPGTQIIDAEEERLLFDLIDENQPQRIAAGGIGGKGNAFFRSSTHQSPRFSQAGMPGEAMSVTLNLKLIADIGLVGLPNAGKSTLLAHMTNAKPKIANYPFTTLTPNLGVFVREDGTYYTIADIPGIIEGAHRGLGLGLSFLQHIERVKAILYLIDVTGDDLAYTLELLKSELRTYNPTLIEKPFHILLTKTDLTDPEIVAEQVRVLGEARLLPISALDGNNMDRLMAVIEALMESCRAT